MIFEFGRKIAIESLEERLRKNFVTVNYAEHPFSLFLSLSHTHTLFGTHTWTRTHACAHARKLMNARSKISTTPGALQDFSWKLLLKLWPIKSFRKLEQLLRHLWHPGFSILEKKKNHLTKNENGRQNFFSSSKFVRLRNQSLSVKWPFGQTVSRTKINCIA